MNWTCTPVEASEPVISAICVGVRPVVTTTVPVIETAFVPDTAAASCGAFMPVATMVVSPTAAFATSAAMTVFELADVSVRSVMIETAAISEATAASCCGDIPVPSTVTVAPPVKVGVVDTLSSSAAICASESAAVTVKVPKMPPAAIADAPFATAARRVGSMPVASTCTPEAPARNAASCAGVSEASAIDFAASQTKASFASRTRSLSSSVSQALPCASLSQFA